MPSLTFNYGNWQFWGDYNPPLYLGEQKVVFDGPNKVIIVAEGVTELDFRVDVYSAWKEWVQDPNQLNAKWPEAISYVGGDPISNERSLGTTFFLENGWRMRPWEGDHSITVTGNAFTREGDPLFVPTLNPWTITINLNTSVFAESFLPTPLLTSADIASLADAVWAEVLSGTTASTRLIELADAIAASTSLTATEVWNYIIDAGKNQAAGDKLKKIATKTQDIALS